MDFQLLIGILPQVFLDGLVLGFMYALIALGYTMVYGVLEFINFAHSESFIFGAFVGVEILFGLKGAGVLASVPWPLLLLVLAAGMAGGALLAVTVVVSEIYGIFGSRMFQFPSKVLFLAPLLYILIARGWEAQKSRAARLLLGGIFVPNASIAAAGRLLEREKTFSDRPPGAGLLV